MRTFKAGEVFDKQYHLVEFLDGGGFADVWLAKRTISTEEHLLALKIYPMLDEEGIRAIEAEYNVQKDLSHSRIITARHFGKDENGYPYLVMKYCNGGNASGKIGQCNEITMARLIYDVCSGLAHLHGNEEIVHQDIKPNNILIDRKDGKDTYYLADLGLSLKVRNTIRKFTEKKGSKSNSLQTGLTPPPYRAPELWDKSNMGKDPIKATDIWALGATMYELITGDTPLGEFGGLMQKNDPAPPDLPAGPGVSADLNTIIKCCLAKDAWDRPKAAELKDWAKSYLSTGRWNIPEKYKTPLKTQPESTETQVGGEDSLPPNPNRRIYMWVAAVLLVLFGGYFGFLNSRGKNLPVIPPDPFVVVDTTGGNEPKPQPVPEEVVPGKIDKNTIVETPVEQPKEKEPPVLLNPTVERSPKSSCINISKISRSREEVIVAFVLCNNTSEDSQYILYSSGDYAYYIEAEGTHYPLRRISPVGGGIIRPNGQVTVTATFAGVPSSINKVHIMEGKDQDRKDRYNWNFIGVPLPRL